VGLGCWLVRRAYYPKGKHPRVQRRRTPLAVCDLASLGHHGPKLLWSKKEIMSAPSLPPIFHAGQISLAALTGEISGRFSNESTDTRRVSG
jgi:hypothetical protein